MSLLFNLDLIEYVRVYCHFSHVQLFVTPWTAACQASLSLTVSWSLSKFMSVESVMPSNHLFLCLFSAFHSFPASGSFLVSRLFTSDGQNIGASALASILPMSIQGWFPLGLTGLISSQSRGLQESPPETQFKSISSSALSLLYGPAFTFIHE